MSTRRSRTAILLAAATVTILLGAVALLVWSSPRSSPPAMGRSSVGEPREPELGGAPVSRGTEASREQIASEETAPTPQRPSFHVSGRVVDQFGEPVAARIFVGAAEDPSATPATAERGPDRFSGLSSEDLLGQFHPTDTEGRFRVELRGPGSVLCKAMGKPGQTSITRDAERRDQRWVSAPADDVVLVVKRVLFGTLSIRAVDAVARTALTSIRISYRLDIGPGGLTGGPGGGAATEDGALVLEVPVPGPGPTLVALELVRPKAARDSRREVFVVAGETLEVVFDVFADAVVEGRVVDGAGTGIAGASVYFGTVKDATGDELFKPFRLNRVDAVETDGDGWFKVSGVGNVITAWHPEHATASVPAAEASRIVMQARGRIHGWLPPPSLADEPLDVVLDRDTRAPLDSSGEFHFDDVDPGVRGLWLPGGRILSVLVQSGATTELRLEDVLSAVEIELLSGGRRLATPLSGLIVGLGQQGSVQELSAEEGLASLEGVLPGRYVAYFREGTIAQLEIDAPRVQLELGAARLLVRTVPGRRIYLLHAAMEDDSFQRLLGARFARNVPASGELEFEPILPGSYSVADERSGNRMRVEVPNQGAEVVVP